MVDEKTNEVKDGGESKTLYSKPINKFSKSGRVVGSLLIETKVFGENKFIQITQEKSAFGDKPASKRWITFDPNSSEIQDALREALKK